MINLLPPKDKEILLLERNKKVVSILGVSVIITLVCLWLILFSLKLHILGEVERQKTNSNTIEMMYQTQDIKNLRSTIINYNTLLTGVDRFYREQKDLHEVIKDILGIDVPPGVFLTTLTIDRVQEVGDSFVTMYGMSATRENLILFKSNIDKSPLIKNIIFPASNWIKAKDINFSVKFEIATESQ